MMSASPYTGPKEVHYMFIDGEQLRLTADAVGNEWFGEPVDLDYRALQEGCQKVFFYDCLPARASGEDVAVHQAKVDVKEIFFNKLRALSGWHVSEGIAKHRKKTGMAQKEVDILIAVDMLTHTHRKNMHRLTFISGDQDFAPLVEAVVRDGMYVELLYPEGHTAKDLKDFADHARPMDVDFMHSISAEEFRSRHKLPVRQSLPNNLNWGDFHLGDCLHDGEPIAKVWRTAGGRITITSLRPDFQNHILMVQDPDENKARKYFLFSMRRHFDLPGVIEWSTVS